MFENRVLRRIFEPKRDEVTGEWRILHIEQLYDLFSSLNVIWVRKSRRDGQGMWHIWEMTEVHVEFWWEDLREGGHLEDLGKEGLIFRKWDVGAWTGSI